MKRIAALLLACLLGVTAAGAQTALDPSKLAIGGRAIGLGRTFIGLADDSTAVFSNPAGLAELKQWQGTSMSGKFMEDYNYLLFSGAYPTEYGVLGASFVGSSTGGVPVTKVLEGTEADPVYVVDGSQPAIDYFNNVFFFTWAKQFWNIELGSSLKIFNTSLSGDSIIDGVGTGTELDLGLKMRPLPYLSVGAVGHNVLPYSLGGRLNYASGYSESYPATFGLGSALTLIGDKNALLKYGQQRVDLLLDADLKSGYPLLYHVGAEWQPIPLIAVRAGLDQDVSTDGGGSYVTESGLAYGVGLMYGGFRFDYAFHQFPGLPGIDNSFFSLTYGPTLPERAAPSLKMRVNLPKDKTITFDQSTRLTGDIFDNRINTLALNGQKVRITLEGTFDAIAELAEGKNKLVVEGRSGVSPLTAEAVRVLRLKSFPDVARDYWVAVPTSLLAMSNVITGYPDGNFGPEGNITRAEMATLLMKTGSGSPETGLETDFKDVKAAHWAASYIAQAAAAGIVKGYPGNLFKPNGKITRAEGVAMIVRFAKVKEWAYADEFSDVGYDHWAAEFISAAKKEGMLKYLTGKRFEPNRALTRAETVELLYQTGYVQALLNKGLLDWNSY